MLKKILLATCVFAGLSLHAQNKMAPSAASMDLTKEEAQKMFDEFSAAWATGDSMKKASFWAPDGDVINPMGVRGKGQDGVAKVFDEEQKMGMKNTTHTFTVEQVTNFCADFASVDAAGVLTGVTGPKGEKMPPMNVHAFLVLTKKSGSWKIVNARPYMIHEHKDHGMHKDGAKHSKKKM